MKAGNHIYEGPADLPAEIPVFPLEGALLLPRGQLPLNIFEPRYIAMIDDAIRSDRIIGMIQPKANARAAAPPLFDVGCAGRITALSETGDGRYLITLSGIARFRVIGEVPGTRTYRICRVAAESFAQDFIERAGEDAVDRGALLRALRDFLDANQLEADWKSVGEATTEALVNSLSMMSPYGPAEKQALLEAPDLKTRAETLVAITEISLARSRDGGAPIQ
jgi:Lon protease-like protein